jgi:hypothetical protein
VREKTKVRGFNIRFRDRVSLDNTVTYELVQALLGTMMGFAEEGRIPKGFEVEAVVEGEEPPGFEASRNGTATAAVPGEVRPVPQVGGRYRIADHGPIWKIDHFSEDGNTAILKREDGLGTSLSRVNKESLRYGDGGWTFVGESEALPPAKI